MGLTKLVLAAAVVAFAVNAFAQFEDPTGSNPQPPSNSDQVLASDPNLQERWSPVTGNTEIIDTRTGEVVFEDTEEIDRANVSTRWSPVTGETEVIDNSTGERIVPQNQRQRGQSEPQD